MFTSTQLLVEIACFLNIYDDIIDDIRLVYDQRFGIANLDLGDHVAPFQLYTRIAQTFSITSIYSESLGDAWVKDLPNPVHPNQSLSDACIDKYIGISCAGKRTFKLLARQTMFNSPTKHPPTATRFHNLAMHMMASCMVPAMLKNTLF